MSNSAGPKITKDGLVLDFDAANPKSYNFYADPYASNVSLHLKMDGANGSTTFTDSSPNALAVTAIGNAQISTTQSKYNGSAGYFDGTGDYLSIAANAAIDLSSSDFAIEFWVRPAPKTNAVDAVFGYGNYACMFYHDGTNWTLEMSSTGSSNQLVITCAVTLNTWQHIAIVRNGSSIVVYKDGVSSATGTFTGAVTTNARILRIGDNGNSQNINGYIDNFKITKGVARYTSAFTSPPIPSTCTDLTKNKNVGTLTNGVDYNFSNGGSLVFDGANDYVTVTNSGLFNFGTADFTIDVWAKVNAYSAGAIQTLINTYTNPSAGWNIQFNVFNTLDFRFSYGDTTLIISGANAILLNQWNNLVISRINNSLVMYVNGRTVTTATDSTNIASGSALVLGRNSPSAIQFLNGNISLARIYKARGLTSGEVYNNFVANRGRFAVYSPATLPVSGAALWLDASQQSTLFTDAGTTAVTTSGQSVYQWNDLSGNNRHATQATSGNRPTWLSPENGQNGLGVISFGGTSIGMTGPWANFDPLTLYVVFKWSSGYFAGRIFTWSDNSTEDATISSGSQSYLPLTVTNSPSLPSITSYYPASASTTSVTQGPGSAFTSGAWVRIRHQRSGTSIGNSVNAGTASSTTMGSTVTKAISQYILGRKFLGTDQSIAGSYAEVIAYNSILSSTDEAKVVAYLQNKWGTP